MADYRRDLIKLLQAAGCECVRKANGSHELWQSPINQRRFVVQHDLSSRTSANNVLKQAGLPKQF
ncbi:MAG: type II toxin-antitoxin system HicA family toxin [Sandaracinobacter sp.]